MAAAWADGDTGSELGVFFGEKDSISILDRREIQKDEYELTSETLFI